MFKIVTFVGTRPEIIKMSRVIAEFDKHTQHVLVHTGQNYDYELNQVFFDELEIRKPDRFLDAAGETASQTIGKVIEKAEQVLLHEKPDAVALYGDTNSCMAVIPAKRLKIPVFHMEAGNRCFDQRVPEELNRKVVDHLSDINMVLTEHARRYLIAEGIRPETIFKTGSHMDEVLNYYADKIELSPVLESEGLSPGDYFLVSLHREENVDSQQNLTMVLDSLLALVEKYQKPVVISTHPRTRKRLQEFGVVLDNPMLRFVKPFGFLGYIKLQKSAFCTLSDSGTITEESSLLGFPAVTIRNAHERPEGMDAGTLIMSGLERESILHSVDVVCKQYESGSRPRPVTDYAGGPVSTQVLRIVLSYTGYVNRTVWRKN